MKRAAALIPPTGRSTAAGSVVILAAVAPFSLAVLLPVPSVWTIIISFLTLVAAVICRDDNAVHLTLFTFFLALFPFVRPSLRAWPYQLLLPLLVCGIIVLAVPRLRRAIQWFRPGRIGRDIAVLIAAISAVSGVFLYLWYRTFSPDLSRHLAYFRGLPFALYLPAGIVFSVTNAALEEIIFRGMVMQSLEAAAGPGLISLAGQAWLFGAAHFEHGFPNGTWGVALAFAYGVMLGAVRRRSRGLLAPWLAHVAADAVIFAILAAIILMRMR